METGGSINLMSFFLFGGQHLDGSLPENSALVPRGVMGALKRRSSNMLPFMSCGKV